MRFLRALTTGGQFCVDQRVPSDPRPGFTVIYAAIDGLSFPFEIPPCELGAAVVSPKPSPFYYFLTWDLMDLQANETRHCESKFVVRAIPNGSIPIQFRNNAVTLATVVFRSQPLASAPTTTFFGLTIMGLLIVFSAIWNLRHI